MPRIALISTSDTDLLSARASGADYIIANMATDVDRLADLTAEAELLVVRLLGGPDEVWPGVAAAAARGVPTVVLGGEQAPQAALMELSSAPIGVVAEAHRYLAEGGPSNLTNLHAFLCDTVLLTGVGFEPPEVQQKWGALTRPELPNLAAPRPRVAVLFYRAQYAAGNSAYAHALADAIDAAGGEGVPIYVTSLRDAEPELLAELGTFDALIATVLAAGGKVPAAAGAGEDDESWNLQHLAQLDIPILQGLCLTTGRDAWVASDDGASPMDVANQVAIPEFDGRIICVPFSFKETDADGLPYYAADKERCSRLAGIALGYARLRHTPPAQRKVALVLSAYPTKHSRIGNAVGLDTPVSAIRLLRALREAGYDIGDALPG